MQTYEALQKDENLEYSKIYSAENSVLKILQD